MKKLYFVLLTAFFSQTLFGTHNIGGGIYYKYLGANTYQITVVDYTDYTIPLGGTKTINVAGGPVATMQVNCIESVANNLSCNVPTFTNVFQGTLQLASNQVGNITLSFGTCCRKPGIDNLSNSQTAGMGVITTIYPAASLLMNNTAALQQVFRRFNYRQDSVLTINSLIYDDNLSDSVYVEFAEARGNNSPLFPPVTYASNYSYDNPFGNAVTTFLNHQSGVITVLNPPQGNYTVVLKIKSFLNGMPTGEVNWDFGVTISAASAPVISWQEQNFTGIFSQKQNNNGSYIMTEADTLNIAVNGTSVLTDSLNLLAFGYMLDNGATNVTGNCTSAFCAQFTGVGNGLSGLNVVNGLFSYAPGVNAVPANKDTLRLAFTFEVISQNSCGVQVSSAFTIVVKVAKVQSIWSSSTYKTCNQSGIVAHVFGDTTNLSWSPTLGVSNPTSATPLLTPSVTTQYTVTNLNNGDTHKILVEVGLIAPPILTQSAAAIVLANGKAYDKIRWFYNGVAIAEDLLQLDSPVSGTYYAQVFTGDCALFSDTVNLQNQQISLSGEFLGDSLRLKGDGIYSTNFSVNGFNNTLNEVFLLLPDTLLNKTESLPTLSIYNAQNQLLASSALQLYNDVFYKSLPLNLPIVATQLYKIVVETNAGSIVLFAPNAFPYTEQHGIVTVQSASFSSAGSPRTDAFPYLAINFSSGIGITQNEISANIYPQPMSDKLVVEIAGNAQFEMLDAAGRVLISESISDKTEINTSALPAGVYLYKLQQNDAVKTGKLLK